MADRNRWGCCTCVPQIAASARGRERAALIRTQESVATNGDVWLRIYCYIDRGGGRAAIAVAHRDSMLTFAKDTYR